MVKTYVVDTNVLLQAPYALESFEDNRVILPMVVLEELDRLKRRRRRSGRTPDALSAFWNGSGRGEAFWRV